jgi:hypothetical protein
MMYVTWEQYVRGMVACGVIFANMVICVISHIASGSAVVWVLMLLSVFSALSLLIYTDDEAPDELHMTRRMQYRVDSDGDIFVKLPFAWVKTKHHTPDGQLLKFQELKSEYVHSGRGRTYEV